MHLHFCWKDLLPWQAEYANITSNLKRTSIYPLSSSGYWKECEMNIFHMENMITWTERWHQIFELERSVFTPSKSYRLCDKFSWWNFSNVYVLLHCLYFIFIIKLCLLCKGDRWKSYGPTLLLVAAVMRNSSIAKRCKNI